MGTNKHTVATNRQFKAARPRSLAEANPPKDVELSETDLGWVSGGRRDPYKN